MRPKVRKLQYFALYFFVVYSYLPLFLNKKALDRRSLPSRANITTRGATLIFTLRDTNISPATDACLCVTEYSGSPLLTVPSAVHLTNCFMPGFQHPRLSVMAFFAVISASTVFMKLSPLYAQVFSLSRVLENFPSLQVVTLFLSMPHGECLTGQNAIGHDTLEELILLNSRY